MKWFALVASVGWLLAALSWAFGDHISRPLAALSALVVSLHFAIEAVKNWNPDR